MTQNPTTARRIPWRPRFGLSAALAAMVLISVGAWFYSPSTPSPLPPRREIEQATVLHAFGRDVPYLGDIHIRSDLSPDAIDRLYAALDEARPSEVRANDCDVLLEMCVYSESGRRHLILLADREGVTVEAYGDGVPFAIFKAPGDAASLETLRRIAVEARESHRRAKNATADAPAAKRAITSAAKSG